MNTISGKLQKRVGFAARVTGLVLGGLLLGAGVASADVEVAATSAKLSLPIVTAPIVAPAGSDINLFSDANLSASIVAQLPAGQNVSVLCTMRGESVTSEINGYSSSLWNGVSVEGSDAVGFVPDVYVDTLTYEPTMPNCHDLWNDDTSV